MGVETDRVMKLYAPHRKYPAKKYKELKETVIKLINKLSPEKNKTFSLKKLVELPGTRGLLRQALKGKFFAGDLYAYKNIIQELVRKDKMLLHKNGFNYVRIA